MKKVGKILDCLAENVDYMVAIYVAMWFVQLKRTVDDIYLRTF